MYIPDGLTVPPPNRGAIVPWFWTDELAELLTKSGLDGAGLDGDRVGDWRTAPVGVWREDPDPLQVAKSLLLDPSPTMVA